MRIFKSPVYRSPYIAPPDLAYAALGLARKFWRDDWNLNSYHSTAYI